MINKKEWFKRNIITFIIGFSLSLVITVSATVILNSRQIRYKNDKSVEQEINELYQKASQIPKKYRIGDEIKVNNIDFYVIAESPRNQDYVVALKKDPLPSNEVNTYGGVGTANNHVNRYTNRNVGQSHSSGGIVYYSSEDCGYADGSNDSLVRTGCKLSYDDSDIKYVVDAWQIDKFINDELKQVDGYKARLITRDEYNEIPNTYNWRYYTSAYWTMTSYGGNPSVYGIRSDGNVTYYAVYGYFCSVRPVINVYKSAIQKTN